MHDSILQEFAVNSSNICEICRSASIVEGKKSKHSPIVAKSFIVAKVATGLILHCKTLPSTTAKSVKSLSAPIVTAIEGKKSEHSEKQPNHLSLRK